jgi:hypothetical protein
MARRQLLEQRKRLVAVIDFGFLKPNLAGLRSLSGSGKTAAANAASFLPAVIDLQCQVSVLVVGYADRKATCLTKHHGVSRVVELVFKRGWIAILQMASIVGETVRWACN